MIEAAGIACARFGESKQMVMNDSSTKAKESALALVIDRKEEKVKLYAPNSLGWKWHLGFSLNNDNDDENDRNNDEVFRDNFQSSGIENDDV